MKNERILVLIEKIERQADCLDGYAESHGFSAEPVASVFHLQSIHFRDIARDLREEING